METWMWTIWLSVFVIALIIEAVGTDLVSIWFALGGLVALVISLIPGVAWWIELIVFTVISVVTLICLRPLVSKYLKRDVISSNIDEITHKKGLITKAVTPLNPGECKINDVLWTAIASDEKTTIKVGSVIEVLAVSGNKLVVKEVKDDLNKEAK